LKIPYFYGSPVNGVNILFFQFLLDGPFPSGVPGLGLPGSSSSTRGYLGSLSNKNGEPTGEFSIEREDFPALGKKTIKSN